MKNIIVTGASKGIGFATSTALADKGHRVIAVARNEQLLNKLVNTSTDGAILPVSADVSNPNDLIKLIKIIESLDGIDGLINNAAILIKKPFSELTMDDWRLQYEVNFFSIIQLMNHLLPHFKKEAHVVNIGSMSGFQGSQKFKGLSAYGTTKAALANLTESLAVELNNESIRVNCLALGAVSTEMLQSAFPNFQPETSADMMGEFIANFTIQDGQLFNGKVISVALNNPS